MFLLLFLAVACGPSSPDPESCEGVAADECGIWSHCFTVEAIPPGSDAMELAGCAYSDDASGLACPPAEICIRDPAEPDACWTSPTGCIPDGWEQGCSDGSDACFDE